MVEGRRECEGLLLLRWAVQRSFCGAMDQGIDHHRDAALGGMLVYEKMKKLWY